MTQRELAGLQACAKCPRGYYWMKPTMQQLERKGLVYSMAGKGGETAYFLTEDGRKALGEVR